MFNSFDESVAIKNQPVWSGALKVIVAIISAGLILLVIAAAIILSLIPIYITKRGLEVVASCGSCSVDIHNRYTDSSVVYDDNAGYYSCENFCAGKLGGTSTADYPTFNYTSYAISAIGGVSYACAITQSSTYNCIHSYGYVSADTGLFYLTNNGICSTPYGAYHCCCRSQSV